MIYSKDICVKDILFSSDLFRVRYFDAPYVCSFVEDILKELKANDIQVEIIPSSVKEMESLYIYEEYSCETINEELISSYNGFTVIGVVTRYGDRLSFDKVYLNKFLLSYLDKTSKFNVVRGDGLSTRRELRGFDFKEEYRKLGLILVCVKRESSHNIDTATSEITEKVVIYFNKPTNEYSS